MTEKKASDIAVDIMSKMPDDFLFLGYKEIRETLESALKEFFHD